MIAVPHHPDIVTLCSWVLVLLSLTVFGVIIFSLLYRSRKLLTHFNCSSNTCGTAFK